MELRDEHLEYAIVYRLVSALETQQGDFEVTSRFAYFSAILIWVAQAMRNKDMRKMVELIQYLKESDAATEFLQGATQIKKSEPEKINSIHTHAGASARLTSYDFLISLRNCFAHLDERLIYPINNRRNLTAYRFHLTIKNSTKNGSSSHYIDLDQRGFTSIGKSIGLHFCGALADKNEEFIKFGKKTETNK